MSTLLALKVGACMSSLVMFCFYLSALWTGCGVNDWMDPSGRHKRIRRHQRISEYILCAALATTALIVAVMQVSGDRASPWLYILLGLLIVIVSAIRFHFNGLRYPIGHVIVGMMIGIILAFLVMVGTVATMFPKISN